MKWPPIMIMLATFMATSWPAWATPRPLTISEARYLVVVALDSYAPRAHRLPGFGIDYFADPFFWGFMNFSATWSGVPGGGSTIDNIDVNMRTADVMEATICKPITSPRVRRLQRRLRRKIGLSAADYKKFKLIGPYCDGARETPWPPEEPRGHNAPSAAKAPEIKENRL